MRRLLSLTGALALAACSQPLEGDTPLLEITDTPDLPADDEIDVDPEPPDNEAPFADAGEDFEAFVAEQVELDGTASYDPDGDALDFDWRFIDKPAGSAALLADTYRPNPTFYADREGLYIVEIAVADGLAVATDEVVVEVFAPNEGPVANAGPDQTVDVGDRVVLNGTNSYDPDGDPLQFSWELVSHPLASTAALDDPSAEMPQFTADEAGLYVVDLVVRDGEDTSLVDQIRITAVDGGDSDCLSCATAEVELRRRIEAGDAASAGLVGLLPVLVLLWQRRRDEA